MIRNTFLTIRTNEAERQLASAVAQRLERNESDAVRYLLRKAAREMGIAPTDERQSPAGKHSGTGVLVSPTRP